MERSWVCKEGSQFKVAVTRTKTRKIQEKSAIHKERKDMQQQQKQKKREKAPIKGKTLFQIIHQSVLLVILLF